MASGLGWDEDAGLVWPQFNSPLPKRICNRNGKCDGDVYDRQNKPPRHDGEKIHPPRVSMYVGVIIIRHWRRSGHDVARKTEKNQGGEA